MSISNAQTASPSFTRNRVQAGVPSGGEFAKTYHNESPVVLGGGAAASGRLAKFTTPGDLVAMTYSSASYWQKFYIQKDKSNHMGLDDIAQEAVVQVLKHVESGKPITNFRQLVNSVAAAVLATVAILARPSNEECSPWLWKWTNAMALLLSWS